jgi:hypothetical protein
MGNPPHAVNGGDKRIDNGWRCNARLTMGWGSKTAISATECRGRVWGYALRNMLLTPPCEAME